MDSFKTRFLVEYETNGEHTGVWRAFASYRSAQTFARRITKDGTAWPSEARLVREVSINNGEFSAFNDAERLLETYIDGHKG